MAVVYFIFGLLLAELAIFVVVSRLRRDFKWLITSVDEMPLIDRVALRKFFATSFDAQLGWVRRPNTTGVEKGRKGDITFRIDGSGSRDGSQQERNNVIAAFGDSYVFCRQVEDDETWESQLAGKTGLGVLNFGVGNYGVDQALLRYEASVLPPETQVVIFGFIPETICRVQSVWKHYLEFGNTFAFKPRFLIDTENREIVLLPNPIGKLEDFERLPTLLPEVRINDDHYRKKFRSVQFRFPYAVSLLRHPRRHTKLISTILLAKAWRLFGSVPSTLESLPFRVIMQSNIADSHREYECESSTDLLRSILVRFRDVARSRGHIPLVVVMPQLLDLKSRATSLPYTDFFRRLGHDVGVIDLSPVFMRGEVGSLYVEDNFGGHLSAIGNQLVAERIEAWLRLTNIVTSSGSNK